MSEINASPQKPMPCNSKQRHPGKCYNIICPVAINKKHDATIKLDKQIGENIPFKFVVSVNFKLKRIR